MTQDFNISVKNKVFLYGIDGATWDVINPLLKDGKLPNLKRIIDTGVRGILKSIEPPVSPMVWTSIATGKIPEKHGVKDFYVTSKSVKTKRIWNILQESGWKVGLMDYLVTWPPEKVHGFCIPSHFAHGIETYPENLSWINKLLMETKREEVLSIKKSIDYISKFLKYRISLKTILNSSFFKLKNRFLRLSFYEYFYPVRKIKIDIRTDILKNLYKRYHVDFLTYITNLVDAASHNYWRFYQPEKFKDKEIDKNSLKKYSSIIADAYIQTDKTLGKILKIFNEPPITIVVSDHGFRANTDESAGVSLTIKPGNIAKVLNLGKNFRYFNIGGSSIFRTIDENKKAEEKLRKELLRFKIYKYGTQVFKLRESKLYNVIITLNNDIDFSEGTESMINAPDGKIYKLEDFVRSSGKSISGTHHPDGIIILNGPMFKNGTQISNASVLDVTPTLLYSINLSIAKDFDGKVLKDAFKDDFVKKNKVDLIDSFNEGWEYREDEAKMENILKRRLEELGYL